MSFAVSGLPHSATGYLARTLNASCPTYRVIHEARNDKRKQGIHVSRWDHEIIFQDARRRFNNQTHEYGEVSAYLIASLWRLNVNHARYVLRNPKEVILSTLNRKNSQKKINRLINNPIRFSKDFEYRLFLIDVGIEKGVPYDYMTNVVQSKNSIEQFALSLGVNMIDRMAISRKKVNSTKKKNFSDWESLPPVFKYVVSKSVQWFIDKYNL